MRVLFITGEFPPMQGGVGDCTNEIALALTQRGVDVAVLTSLLPTSALRPPSAVTILPLIKTWNWSALSQIRKTISKVRPDIVHIQYQTGAFGMQPMINFLPRFVPRAPLTPRPPLPKGEGERTAQLSNVRPSSLPRPLLPKGEGGRVAVTFHDLLPAYLFPKAGPLRDWVTFQLARGTDAVVATNSADYARLRENVCGLKKWLKLIPIGSNIAPTTPPPDFNRLKLRDQLGVRDDETLLVYFGFLNASKGAETLIHALYNLPQAKLLFLGGQTGASDVNNVAYLEHVKQEIRDWGLEQRVLWTDFLPAEQVSAHFYASDVCVLPYCDGASFRRGSFMAALAHGIPIVTTHPQASAVTPLTVQDERFEFSDDLNLPALRDGDNVLLVPPDDPDAIVLAVTRVRTSPGLAALLSGNARSAARAFSWNKIADEHVELYERMMESL